MAVGDVKDFEMVNAICQYGSFSRAAEELYIGQSSLSMAIQRIEAELGMPIFDRRQHPARLTAAGEEYMRFYQQVKPLQNNMMAKIRDLAELKTGTVTLGGTHYLLSYVLPETIVRFVQMYPGIDLRIVEAQSGKFKEKLINCEIDFCLKCDATDPKLQTISHAFFDKLFLAVPKDLVAEKNLSDNWLSGEDIRNGKDMDGQHDFLIEDIPKLTFLQLAPGNNLYRRSEEIFAQLGRRPNKVILFQQFVTAYNLAESGLGCTLVSSRLIARQSHPNLVYYSLPSPLMIRDFHFTTRKNAYISNATRAFCALFADMEEKAAHERQRCCAKYI